MTWGDVKDNLSAMLHGGSLNKVRNVEMAAERAANTMLSKIDPIDTIRTSALTNLVHDDITNYSLPSDYKKIIDLYPQADRGSDDTASRRPIEKFDLTKELTNRTIAVSSNNGSKFLKINWADRSPKVLNACNSLTVNGTWSAVGTASGLVADSITKYSGSASIRFDVNATGDGIQNTTMTATDMTDEDEVADVFIWVYVGDTTNLTSISAIWGNDLTANYWTGATQTTQADGTAFQNGWNLIKFAWSSATETGTVDPTTIDSFKITINSTGVIANVRVDNILFSIGRAFDLSYYSKYIFKNTAGTWITKPTTDLDTVVLDNDAMQIFLLECLIAIGHQIEGENSGFDINFAKNELGDPTKGLGLYAKYVKEYPTQAKKEVSYYGSNPSRGRW